MAMQISIEKGREERGIGHNAATWAVTAIDLLGRALVWVFDRMQSVRGGEGKRKQMQLVESLALGNRRQLLLVVCGNQRYLVGAGADSVSSIVAMETVAGLAESAGSGAGTRPRSIGRTAKGPELVRCRARQIASEHDAGAGVWS